MTFTNNDPSRMNDVPEQNATDEIKEEVNLVKNKQVVTSPEGVVEVTEDEFKEMFGDTYYKQTVGKSDLVQNYASGDFRSEEYEFKKFIVTPDYTGPFVIKELGLSQLKDSEVPLLAEILNFASELDRVWAKATAEYFFRRILFHLQLKVSVNGFGRKELNTSRQEVSSTTEEKPAKKGFSLIRGD